MKWTRGAPVLWIAVACLVGAVAGLIVGWGHLFPATTVFSTLLFGVLGVLFIIDAKTMYLPDPWLIIAGALALLHPIAIMATSDLVAGGFILLLAAVGVSIGYCAFAITRILSNNQLGLGDVKLAAVLGGWLLPISWTALGLALVFAVAIGAVWVLAAVATGKKTASYGPAMVLGAILATGLS
ncbi:prepilin peptidase [Flaviflexus sp.]|uniref:prepilin peptidase n=1 Tax=Flaviflexus sp. TaxID=1969482 RepID=UPI003F939D2B